jgi:3-phenylpropionate/trans-cinnamate dioxygenase ferredoxin subunit
VTLPHEGSAWVRVAPADALPAGGIATFDIDGEQVALFHTEDGFRALGGLCLHMAAQLSDGHVVDDSGVCPLHAWRYDLATGARTDRRGQGIATYPIEIRDGWLFLGLSQRKLIS